MVLHELCSTLNALGCRAGILFIIEGSQKAQGFKFAYSNEKTLLDPEGQYYDFTSGKTNEEIGQFIGNACVIYPDIVKGNPIGGRRSVVYVLGKPEFEIEAEFVVAFSKAYIEKFNCVLFKPFISEWMHDRGTHHWSARRLDLTYIGKGAEYLECRVIPGSVLVERNWPQDKRQLAALLRNCRYFFSWDNLTATNLDAMLCGAVPVSMHELQFSPEEAKGSELGYLFPLKYTAGMENSTDLGSIAAVDKALSFVQTEARKSLDEWPTRVREFAEAVAKFYSHGVFKEEPGQS